MSVPPAGGIRPLGSQTRGSSRMTPFGADAAFEEQMRKLMEQGMDDYQSFYERYMKMQQEQNRPRQSRMYYLGGY